MLVRGDAVMSDSYHYHRDSAGDSNKAPKVANQMPLRLF